MKKRIITSLISIALFSGSASVLAEKGGNDKGKGYGAGGVSEEHMNEVAMEHNKSAVGDKAHDMEEYVDEMDVKKEKKVKKDKDMEDDDADEMRHEMKEQHKSKERTEKEASDDESHGELEQKKKWWQFFSDDDE